MSRRPRPRARPAGSPIGLRAFLALMPFASGPTACGLSSALTVAPPHGVPISPALARPEFEFVATDGRPFDFRRRTTGRLTLLYFGYTRCADACPMQLAELAAGIHALPAREQSRITTIFVTVDPARDSAAQVRTWLDQFSRTFIGLRAPLDATNRVLTALARPAAMDGAPSTTVAPRIGHGTEILAFTADDSAHVAYPIGTGRADWTTDLHDLLRHDPDRSRS